MSDIGLQDYLNIGNTLKKIRKEKGYTQKKFAEKADIPVSTYSNYENGNRNPNLQTLQKFADLLNVSLSEIILSAAVRKEKLEHLSSEEKEKISDEVYTGAQKLAEVIKTHEFERSQSGIFDGDIFEDMERHDKIIEYLGQLNVLGRQTAVERIEELTKIPEYRKDKQPPK